MTNKPTPMRYVGLDLSLRSPAFSIIEVENRVPKYVASRTVKTNTKMTDGASLTKITEELLSFLDEFGGGYDKYIKEQSFSRFATETKQIYQTVGAVVLTLHPVVLEEIANTTIKKLVGGNGKSSKEEVFEGVCSYLCVPHSTFQDVVKGKLKLRNDESDACGVVLGWLLKNDLIDTLEVRGF